MRAPLYFYTPFCTFWGDAHPAKLPHGWHHMRKEARSATPQPGSQVQDFDLRMDALADYRICVQGHLDESWSERLGGLEVQSTLETTITTLTGSLPDQAALSGVLNTLYDLQLPMLSVELLHRPS